MNLDPPPRVSRQTYDLPNGPWIQIHQWVIFQVNNRILKRLFNFYEKNKILMFPSVFPKIAGIWDFDENFFFEIPLKMQESRQSHTPSLQNWLAITIQIFWSKKIGSFQLPSYLKAELGRGSVKIWDSRTTSSPSKFSSPTLLGG